MIFWDNLLRYPKFFISSMIGLILILLNPIINQMKKFNNKIVFLILIIVLIVLFYILKEMLTID
uniref:Uncharacterized protein ycf33 n=1 Tax=Desmarestia aculeata TaxID=62298 RepID=A0A8F0JZX0_9PHAE|nr:hypothetical protein V2483_pgp014 [Desmarestia aculeata]QWK43760.1 hypothetical protein [Desmarestia aculeata]WAM62962.1 hypothetical protein [Desmarestia aculeata]